MNSLLTLTAEFRLIVRLASKRPADANRLSRVPGSWENPTAVDPFIVT